MTLLIDKKNACTALAKDGRLIEVFIDAAGGNSKNDNAGGSWVGRVIVGRLKTILPGQFAFVDIGAKKNAFMNLRKGHGLRAGTPVLVQVEKDAIGTKGMCVTTDICLKGRLVVLRAPVAKHVESVTDSRNCEAISVHSKNGPPPGVGVSRKIDCPKEAARLKKILRKALPHGFSAVVRTNAAGQSEEALTAELVSLHATLEKIADRAQFALPPTVLWPIASGAGSEVSAAGGDGATGTHSAVVPEYILSDILSDDIEEIHVQTDSDEEFLAIKHTICQVFPVSEGRIFREMISLKKQIRAALTKEVRLPCGGFITIEQTEACVVIDVNTGSNVGDGGYRQTVLVTNIEAAAVIAAQLRLRNLSGIVIVDFISMQSGADKQELLTVLAAETAKDRIKVEILGFTALGMVEMTRARVRPPLAEMVAQQENRVK